MPQKRLSDLTMPETLQYVRKNRGQVAKDVSALLSVKNITEIRIAKKEDGIYVYSGNNNSQIPEALKILIEHVTNGTGKHRNPYGIPAVQYAIRVLQEEKNCPAKWGNILIKPSKVYLQGARDEETEIKERS